MSAIPQVGQAAEYVRHHQERYDGSGYPDGIRGEEIPLGARIIGLAEAYVNMISERPYAESRTPGQALAEIERWAGKQFDEHLVRIMIAQLRGEKSAAART
jgi:HD-GYP domain-containing protein (c-di-GMP phosphodiesterase class II)